MGSVQRSDVKNILQQVKENFCTTFSCENNSWRKLPTPENKMARLY